MILSTTRNPPFERTTTCLPLSHPAVPGRRRRSPGSGTDASASPLTSPHRTRLLLLLLLTLQVARLSVLVVGHLGEEVGRDETALAVYLAQIEAVVVHLAVDVDDLTGRERQFLLQL